MKYSEERLYHFNCDCGKWFSISDLCKLGATIHTEIACPFCKNTENLANMQRI